MNEQPILLIVDDTPANIGILFGFMNNAGIKTLVALGGADALEQIELQLPDIILLDVMMPDVDGFETCRRLKAADHTRDIPVIFMTALTDTADKVKGFQVGAVDYVTKPIQQDEVLARVTTHLTIRRLQRKLAAEIELKERFMSIASHDLRNLVGNILASADILTMDDQDHPILLPSHHELIGQIQSSGHQMIAVMNNFLRQQRAQGGHLVAHPAALDLNALCAAVAAEHTASAQRKHIALRTELAPNLPRVRADKSLTHQILSNYLSNALKYSPTHTTVTLRSLAGAYFARVEVQDQGPGVDPAERDQLFQARGHISNLPTANEESTGLGLSIVKVLAEAQGGLIGADFPAQGGSIFHLRLPREE